MIVLPKYTSKIFNYYSSNEPMRRRQQWWEEGVKELCDSGNL
ncbi:hypothetical protein ACJIZ3_001543 [Penstemon smallii]|uniref:Uncharacterized protein n=1 Tax=Penstemon smallii TaxID=265156 RepID=A0ABD3U579_9LAMI